MNWKDVPAPSRGIFGGKKTAKFEFRASDELKEAARRKWMDAGFQSESEYLETLVTIDVFGVEHMRMLLERRLRAVCPVSDMRTTQTADDAQ